MLEPRSTDEPEPDPARPEMALDGGDLDEVLGGVRDRGSARGRELQREQLGDHLIGDEPDHASRSPGPGNPEVVARDGLDANRVLHPLGHFGPLDLVDRLARLEDDVRLEANEVGQHEQIGPVPGCDRAEAPEAMPLGRVVRGEDDGVLGSDSRGDRLSHHAVDVPRRCDVLGVAVVCAEGDVAGTELGDERQERLQIPRHRRLPDEEPHSRSQPFAAFLRGERLVVRADARRRVRVQLLSQHPGRVPVDVRPSCELELGELGLVTRDDAREVHHLREPEDSATAEEALEIAFAQRTPRRLERRGRNRGRRHEVEVERHLRARVE